MFSYETHCLVVNKVPRFGIRLYNTPICTFLLIGRKQEVDRHANHTWEFPVQECDYPSTAKHQTNSQLVQISKETHIIYKFHHACNYFTYTVRMQNTILPVSTEHKGMYSTFIYSMATLSPYEGQYATRNFQHVMEPLTKAHDLYRLVHFNLPAVLLDRKQHSLSLSGIKYN